VEVGSAFNSRDSRSSIFRSLFPASRRVGEPGSGGWVFIRVGRESGKDGFDLRFESGQVIACRFKHPNPIHLEIIMDHDVTHSLDLSPGNLRVLLFDRLGYFPSSLANDQDMSVHVGLQRWIPVERGTIDRKIPRDNLEGVENVQQSQTI